MLDLPSVSDFLTHVHIALGEPPLVPVKPSEGAHAVRSAILAAQPEGALIALLADSPAEARLVRGWFAIAGVPVEARATPVAEGWLVLGHVTAQVPARPSDDALPVPGARLRDLDPTAVTHWLRASDRFDQHPVSEPGTAEERALGRIRVLRYDGRLWRPTVAAMVVAGRRTELFLPACQLLETMDGQSRTIQGALMDLWRGAGDALDPRVLREALFNAILHRDWTNPEPIELKVTGQRLELTNPGRLRRGAPGRRPNPLLVSLAVALGLARDKGEGLRKIARQLERTGQPPYSLLEQEGRVRFVAEVAPFKPPAPARSKKAPKRAARPPVQPTPAAIAPVRPAPSPPPEPAVEPPVPPLTPAVPSDRGEAVLVLLRERGRMTTRELADALGSSRPVVGKLLTVLVAEGRVRPLAEGRSPFQAYALTGG